MKIKIELVFDKEKALELSRALEDGTPIGMIDADDLLTLAGACLCRHYQLDVGDEACSRKNSARLVRNLMNAVEHCAEWTLRAKQGTFERTFKPTVHATIDNGVTAYPGKVDDDQIG